MKHIYILLGLIILILGSCSTPERVLVKPQTFKVGTDSTSYTTLQQDYITNFKSEKLVVYNSEEIKIEETFCYIGNKDSILCIANSVKALTPGIVTKVVRKRGKGIKIIVISFKEKDYVYNLSFFKTKDQYGAEEFVLSGDVELYFQGKIHNINATTKGICKLLVK